MLQIGWILFLCLVVTGINAQDTIFQKNKTIIPAKVLEVGTEEIKFKKTDNPEGPVYRLPLSEVYAIHYKGGIADTFNVKAKAKETPIVIYQPAKSKLEYDSKGFYFNNRRMGTMEVSDLLQSKKDPKINFWLSEAKKDKIFSGLCAGFSIPAYVIGGGAALLTILFSTTNTSSTSNNSTNQVQVTIPIALVGLLGGGILSFNYKAFKKKYFLNMGNAIDRYNSSLP